MRSVGIELGRHRKAGLLHFEATRPSVHGFEMHLARMNRDIETIEPSIIVVDPISAFRGPSAEIHATLVRLADICKTRGITSMFTSLSGSGELMTDSDRSVSSLMDSWVSLTNMEANGELNRILCLLKSRGMSHSKQLREYRLTDDGIELIDAYVGPDGVLTGTARLAQEARERESALARGQATERRRREVARRRDSVEREMTEMRAAIEAEEAEVATLVEQEEARESAFGTDRSTMATHRGAHP